MIAAVLTITCAIFQPMLGSNVTAGYGSIKNESKTPVTLTLKSVEAFKAVELHETYDVNGNAGMRRIESFKLAPGQILTLKPGGNHMMLFDATRSLKLGEKLSATFAAEGKDLKTTCLVKDRPTGP